MSTLSNSSGGIFRTILLVFLLVLITAVIREAGFDAYLRRTFPTESSSVSPSSSSSSSSSSSVPSPPVSSEPKHFDSLRRHDDTSSAPIYAEMRREFQQVFCRRRRRAKSDASSAARRRDLFRVGFGMDSLTHGRGGTRKNRYVVWDRRIRKKEGNYPEELRKMLMRDQRLKRVDAVLRAVPHSGSSSWNESAIAEQDELFKGERHIWYNNFGLPGAPMRFSKPDELITNITYRNMPDWPKWRQFKPHVSLWLGGTNDAKDGIYTRDGAMLKSDLNFYIDGFLENKNITGPKRDETPFRPWFIVLTPLPVDPDRTRSAQRKHGINATRVTEVAQRIREVAHERRHEVDFLDLNRIWTKRFFSGNKQPCSSFARSQNNNNSNNQSATEPRYSCLLHDGIHPTNRGAYELAKIVFEKMCDL